MKNPNPNQTVFDRALLALRKQGIASLSAGETCALRGQAGTKCAIGHLIPDDAYYEALEHVSGVGVVTGIDQALTNALEADVAKASVNLLADLQLAHDSHMPRPAQTWPRPEPVWHGGVGSGDAEHCRTARPDLYRALMALFVFQQRRST